MKKLGLLFTSIGVSQMGESAIVECNKLIDKYSPDIDIIGFYRDPDKSLSNPHFALMPSSYAYSYDGTVIATSIDTGKELINLPGPIKKYLYVWDFEWMFNPLPLAVHADIYQNEELELIARSPQHFKILSQMWKTPVATIRDFNHEEIYKLIN